MPIYEYECPGCALRFERLRKMSESDAAMECPECRTPATKVPSVVNHAFVFPASQLRGSAPPNTGTSFDHNADRVIGLDAEKKWRVIGERQAVKRKVIADNPGSTGHDLSRTPDGEYKVMKPTERRVVETARKIHRGAMAAKDAAKKGGGGGTTPPPQ